MQAQYEEIGPPYGHVNGVIAANHETWFIVKIIVLSLSRISDVTAGKPIPMPGANTDKFARNAKEYWIIAPFFVHLFDFPSLSILINFCLLFNFMQNKIFSFWCLK